MASLVKTLANALLKFTQFIALIVWLVVAGIAHSCAVSVGFIEEPSLKIVDMRGKVCIVTGANTGIG
jgi:hypothetical protein